MSHKALATLGAFALLAVFPALAERPLEFNVPFDFKVGQTRMPAGAYNVDFPASSTVMIRSVDRRHAAIVLTISEHARQTLGNSKLVFNQYGDQYFLWQVWSAGYEQGRVLNKSKAEVEMARRITPSGLVALQPRR